VKPASDARLRDLPLPLTGFAMPRLCPEVVRWFRKLDCHTIWFPLPLEKTLIGSLTRGVVVSRLELHDYNAELQLLS
jgi:hypothetical protein